MVTSSGALLMGPLGGALDAIREDVSAAAWSDDGALLAYARHESITVLDLPASASFTTRLMTGVGACTNSSKPNARPRYWRQLHWTAMFVVVCGAAITRTLPCMLVSDAQRPGCVEVQCPSMFARAVKDGWLKNVASCMSGADALHGVGQLVKSGGSTR